MPVTAEAYLVVYAANKNLASVNAAAVALGSTLAVDGCVLDLEYLGGSNALSGLVLTVGVDWKAGPYLGHTIPRYGGMAGIVGAVWNY